MINTISEFISFFPDAVFCGLAIGTVCSILGVFVILKRVVFISIVLSETAACGIALSMMVPLSAFGISACSCSSACTHSVTRLNPLVGATALTLFAVMLLSLNIQSKRIPKDALLGLVFLMASSLSILLVAKSGFGLEEVKNLLYGNLILASRSDTKTILFVAVPALAGMLIFLRPMLYSFLDRDAAQVMRIDCAMWETLFFVVLGIIVSAASQTAGALLVFCYLVVVPSSALILSKRLPVVLLTAPALAAVSTMTGLIAAYIKDLPANQTITVAAGIVFCLTLLFTQTAKTLRSVSKKMRAAA